MPDAVSLDDFVAAGLPGVDRAARVDKMSAFAGRLIDTVSKAHTACVFHYDLKWRNILVQRRGGEYHPVFIDCPRAFVSCLRRSYGVNADMSALARLGGSYLTLGQRYRFLAACLGKQADSASRKAWYRRVQRRLGKRLPKMISLQESPLQGVRFDGKY